MSDLVGLPASELAALIVARRVSAREAVAAHIERIQSLDDRIRAVVVPLFDEALAEAAKADATTPEGRPLHGVPVTVKECYDVRGTASTLGVDHRRNQRAENDAELVAKLRAAGAIVLGKTNVSQLLLYVEADNPVYGRTNNPWNLERSPGGSSGGEGAAVAAGYSALGLGTDIGGSVRVPAHFCGVHSLKPTPGRLSLRGTAGEAVYGHYAIADAAGLLGRTVRDLRLGFSSLGMPVAEVAIKGLRVGFYEDDRYFPASAAIRRAVREAAQLLSAGCTVEPFQVPEVREALDVFYGLLTVDGGDGPKAFMGGSQYDARIKDLMTLATLANPLRAPVATLYRLRGQQRVAELVGVAGRQSADAAAKLVARRDALRQRFRESMKGLDVLIGPPCAVPAVTHGATRQLGPASVSYTLLFNALAWPAGVVAATRVRAGEQQGREPSRDEVYETARKVDQGSAGLPVGVQVIARPGREDLILAVMAELEASFRGGPDYPATPVSLPSGVPS